MTESARSSTWLRIAVVYFVVGVSLGIVMGASGDHGLMPVHAHINLLGWVSMTLFGLIGRAHPDVLRGPLAAAHFWLYNLGVPALLVGLTALLRGNAALGPVVGALSMVVGVAVLLFAYLAFSRIKPAVAA